IAMNESALEEGTDYTVAGSVVTFQKAFLASLPEGTTSLAFSFDKGADKNVTLVIKDSSAGGSISVNDDDAGIRYEGAWNRSYNRGLGDYKDDVHFLENNGEYMEYPFTGTGIELYSELDPSQGDIDIYVDGDFKQTLSTSNAGRLANQSVYHIAGLTDGPHTLKAVKKSGVFMLVDQLKVTLPDLITPQSANFDKAASEQADVTAAIAAGRTLSGISGNGTPLAAGNDYAVTDDQVTIKKGYLAARPVGTANLIFSFSGGAEQVLAIEVADSDAQNSTISPAEASFDKNTAELA
ncbi:hypothetical protein K0U00_41540, partial [Paenibacillus sepulcri]|nr:hypothetical protein [Paenibacillus sepulcri]